MIIQKVATRREKKPEMISGLEWEGERECGHPRLTIGCLARERRRPLEFGKVKYADSSLEDCKVLLSLAQKVTLDFSLPE